MSKSVQLAGGAGSDFPISALDRILRSRLISCRLVGELGVDGELFSRAKQFASEIPSDEREIRRFGSKHPAVFLYYLVGTAAHQGDGGELWPFVPFACDDGACQQAAGKAFAMACKVLGLEDFTDEVVRAGGKRNIAPILMHAMVPRQSVPGFLRLVLDQLRDGVVEATDIVAYWRRDTDHLYQLSAPARRFITRGDDLAVDYVRRVVDLLRTLSADPNADTTRIGLPEYVSLEYSEMAESASTIELTTVGPRPRLELDPWSSSGPELVLPATRQVDEWILVADGKRSRILGSDLRETLVALTPARSWEVEGRNDGSTVSKLKIESRPGGTLVFSPRTFEIDRDDTITSDEVLILHGRSVSLGSHHIAEGLGIEEGLRDVEQCPELFGDWSHYQVRWVSLDGVAEVVADAGEPSVGGDHIDTSSERISNTVFRTAAARPKAQLVGSATPHVTDSSGRDVYDSVPLIALPPGSDPNRWSVVAKLGSKTIVDGLVSDHTAVDDAIWKLRAECLDGDLVGTIELDVRGPLGSDLHADFLVVSGLNVEVPEAILAPRASVEAKVSADPEVRLIGVVDGRVDVASGNDRALVCAEAESGAVNFHIRVPRLVWAFSEGIAPESFGADPSEFDMSELLRRRPRLWVRVGRGGEEIQLSLCDGSDTRQATAWIRCGPELGRASFSLDQFSDTIRVSDAPELTLALRVAGGPAADVALLARNYVVSELVVQHRLAAGMLDVLYDEERRARDRQIAVWPVDAPWATPTLFQVPDSADPNEGLSFDASGMARGTYVCRVFAGSKAPLFPGRTADGTAIFEVGEQDGASQAPQSVPTMSDVEEAGDPAASVLVSRALSMVTASIDPPRGVEIDSIKVDCAVEACFARPALIYRALLSDTEERLRRSESLRVKFVLRMLQGGAVDCPPRDAMTILEYGDLWDFSPILAAAADHKNGDLTLGRWGKRTGWLPSEKLPFPGKRYSSAYADASVEKLGAARSRFLEGPVTLLGERGFGVAMIDFLATLPPGEQRESELMSWRRRHSSVLRPGRKDFPASIIEVATDYGKAAEPEIRFPGDLFMAGANLVCFCGNQIAALRALMEAADFAPALVQRQVLVALVHHLVSQDMIDLWQREA